MESWDLESLLELIELRRTELQFEQNADQHTFMAHTQQMDLQFRYAISGLAIAGIGLISVIGGFIFLVALNHPEAAGVLLGAGILGLIGGFLKIRLQH
jgi:small-conductance mechanosensitive channel